MGLLIRIKSRGILSHAYREDCLSPHFAICLRRSKNVTLTNEDRLNDSISWILVNNLVYYNGYLFSAINLAAILRRASLTLKGLTFVNRFNPSNIMSCSSPSAKELIASFPNLLI